MGSLKLQAYAAEAAAVWARREKLFECVVHVISANAASRTRIAGSLAGKDPEHSLRVLGLVVGSARASLRKVRGELKRLSPLAGQPDAQQPRRVAHCGSGRKRWT